MCVICVKSAGVEFPSLDNIINMFDNNPDGAGYMFNRNNKVTIRKGFMSCNALINSMFNVDKLTKNDNVIIHFRISTQAGRTAAMTHPFPFTDNLENMLKLNFNCSVGVAHNGIIRLTSNPEEKRYNDTALFIANYLTKIVRCYNDLKDPIILDIISNLTNSKFAMLTKYGDITTIGNFIKDKDGCLYSNASYSYNKYDEWFYNPIIKGGKKYNYKTDRK